MSEREMSELMGSLRSGDLAGDVPVPERIPADMMGQAYSTFMDMQRGKSVSGPASDDELIKWLLEKSGETVSALFPLENGQRVEPSYAQERYEQVVRRSSALYAERIASYPISIHNQGSIDIIGTNLQRSGITVDTNDDGRFDKPEVQAALAQLKRDSGREPERDGQQGRPQGDRKSGGVSI